MAWPLYLPAPTAGRVREKGKYIFLYQELNRESAGRSLVTIKTKLFRLPIYLPMFTEIQ